MKKMLCVFIIMLIPNLVFAVDGYKDFIFGKSVKEVQNIAPNPLSLHGDKQKSDLSIYTTNIDFGGVNTVCGLAFLDDKLARVVFDVSPEQIVNVLSSLHEKYGEPTEISLEQLEAFDDGKPNIDTYVRYDNNTVGLNIVTDESSKRSASLIYQTQNFDAILHKINSNKLKNDI